MAVYSETSLRAILPVKDEAGAQAEWRSTARQSTDNSTKVSFITKIICLVLSHHYGRIHIYTSTAFIAHTHTHTHHTHTHTHPHTLTCPHIHTHTNPHTVTHTPTHTQLLVVGHECMSSTLLKVSKALKPSQGDDELSKTGWIDYYRPCCHERHFQTGSGRALKLNSRKLVRVYAGDSTVVTLSRVSHGTMRY